MKKFIHSLTKAGRRKRRRENERNFVDRIRFAEYESLYREKVLQDTTPGVGNEANDTITVTLTSFGTRIETVYLAVESLMRQSLKADRILLCLARDEFKETDLPATLQRQRERGLEILFCEEGLGPYTKFYYTLQKYPDDLIITVDDDLIYPVDTIDPLYRAYQKEPNAIHCNRGHRMTFHQSGKLRPYREWEWNHTSEEPSLAIFPTGVGGVLYFPHSLNASILDKQRFLRVAPYADDVWLKAMSLKNSVPCRQTSHTRSFGERAVEISGSQTTKLKQYNKSSSNRNDAVLEKVFHEFGLRPRLDEFTSS